ncbi:MAG: hypothetical protein KME05_12385 [Gloeocapsa sp. UFS-A4-WI-NPMV-4B04]|nr:hypothetical protein [Gloeocapsa sp. UFS-A4-WI-NPMV-4B04]
MVHNPSRLSCHLLNIALVERVTIVPADVGNNNFGQKVSPLEEGFRLVQLVFIEAIYSTVTAFTNSSSVFATQPEHQCDRKNHHVQLRNLS